MAKLATSVVSSSARKLALRRRPDLAARRHRYQGRSYWVVKDPVALNYFRFEEEEFSLLEMLDGSKSLDDIKDEFETRFPPQKISLHELQQFLTTLHKSGLILADVPGQGRQLLERHRERRWKEFISKASNLLSLRFKGVDPDRFLNWLYPKVAWLFSPTAVFACLALAVSALLLVLVQFEVFQSKLPAFHQFFSVQNAFWLAVALAGTKVLHELGHAMSCKHFGGECHEIGVLILVLTPCLYCNVSDSWMLPNKWRRAAIGAAGMYVELIIASVCTFVWWFTEPGLLNNLCLSTMFVSSVSTVVFNGNPLLRYDGYYILSDILEIPNLSSKASEVLQRFLGKLCLGIDPPENAFLPERNRFFFGLYAVASMAYRWMVVLSILLFLNAVLKPYRLEVLGRLLALTILYGLFVQPVFKLFKYFQVPGRLEKVKKVRLLASLAAVAGVVAFVLYVPLPNRVFCTMELEARDPENIYVEVPGELAEVYVEPGQEVDGETLLASLTNVDLELAVVELIGRRDEYRAQLDSLRQQRHLDNDAALLMPEIEKMVETYDEQIAEKKRDIERLRLVSHSTGTVLPPAEAPRKQNTLGQLATWSGSPFEKRNLNCRLTESTLFCQIADPREFKAVLVIDQHDRNHVSVGQRVDLQFDTLRDTPYRDLKIEEISAVDVKVSPRHLSNKAGGELATKTDESGMEVPLSVSYHASVHLDDPDGLLRLGLKGRAKIHAGSLTLGQQLWRIFSRTFNFEL